MSGLWHLQDVQSTVKRKEKKRKKHAAYAKVGPRTRLELLLLFGFKALAKQRSKGWIQQSEIRDLFFDCLHHGRPYI